MANLRDAIPRLEGIESCIHTMSQCEDRVNYRFVYTLVCYIPAMNLNETRTDSIALPNFLADLAWEYHDDTFQKMEEMCIETGKRRFALDILERYINAESATGYKEILDSLEAFLDMDILNNQRIVLLWFKDDAYQINLYHKSTLDFLFDDVTDDTQRYEDFLDKEKHIFVIDIVGEYLRWIASARRETIGELEDKIMNMNDFALKKIEKPKSAEITDVTVYNDRVVKMHFSDGTFTKAVCGANDTFNLDAGITVCLVKKMLGGQKNGTKTYNDVLRAIHEAMAEKEKRKADAEAEKERQAAKRRKTELKKAARSMKRREEQIDIHKQAILRAMSEREDDLK